MKKLLLILLFLMPLGLVAQPFSVHNWNDPLTLEKNPYLYRAYYDSLWHFESLISRDFTGAPTDTTEAVYLGSNKTVVLALMSQDSVSIRTAYQLSLDGVRWTDPVAADSLKETSDSLTIKTIDFSSVANGIKWIRWILTTSAEAYALGTTSPYYWVALTLRPN